MYLKTNQRDGYVELEISSQEKLSHALMHPGRSHSPLYNELKDLDPDKSYRVAKGTDEKLLLSALNGALDTAEFYQKIGLIGTGLGIVATIASAVSGSAMLFAYGTATSLPTAVLRRANSVERAAERIKASLA